MVQKLVKGRPSAAKAPERRRTRRDVAAEATERAIVDAAFELFRERGYHGTSMEDIANAAGVAVQTIYNSIGGKRAVLSRIIDLVAAGPEAPTSVPRFMADRIAAAATPSDAIAILADWFVDVHRRMADVWDIVAQAAAIDPTVAELELERATARFLNYHRAAASIVRLGGRAELPEPEAAAAIWSLGHPLMRRFLVVEQGWSDERYREWLAACLGRILTSPFSS